ncbi:MAG: DUF2723 domain-containing protein [Chloroflexi bacterium]|nr:DUF2723 domain-containing protein [Chloroflexota bacterium]
MTGSPAGGDATAPSGRVGEPAPVDDPGRARALVAAALVAGLVAFALGWLHLLPGVAFWDTGEMQTVGPVFGTAHPTGYPTYVALGWLASVVLQPFGSPAFVMNLLNALLIGGAAAVATLLFGRLTERPVLALAGGLVVALMPEAWYLATHADPHALHALLLGVVLLLLVVWGDRRRAGLDRTDRWLVAAAAVYGASLGNQALMLLVAPGIALFVLATEPRILLRPRMLLGCAVTVLGVAALAYLQLPLAVALDRPLIYARPGTWDGFWYIVLGEQFRGSLGDPLARPLDTLRAMVDAMTGQLGLLAIAAVPAAVVTAIRRPRYALLTVPAFVITLVFAAVYDNAEIDRYHLGPAIVAVSWLVVGAGWIVELVEGAARRPRASAGPAPAGVAGAVAAALLAVALVLPQAARLPASERRASEVGILDARSFVESAFAAFEPDATVVSWWSYSTPLWYGTIVEGRRGDLRIVDDRTRLDEGLGDMADVIRADLPERPVYVIPGWPDLRDLEEAFVLEPVFVAGNQTVYRVASDRGATP